MLFIGGANNVGAKRVIYWPGIAVFRRGVGATTIEYPISGIQYRRRKVSRINVDSAAAQSTRVSSIPSIHQYQVSIGGFIEAQENA